MTAETEFCEGLIVKAPNEKAPGYVKARLSIKREELIAWLQGREGDWVNLDVKEAKSGKWYAAVDNWKPNGKGGERSAPRQESRSGGGGSSPPVKDDDFDDRDIPFASPFGLF